MLLVFCFWSAYFLRYSAKKKQQRFYGEDRGREKRTETDDRKKLSYTNFLLWRDTNIIDFCHAIKLYRKHDINACNKILVGRWQANCNAQQRIDSVHYLKKKKKQTFTSFFSLTSKSLRSWIGCSIFEISVNLRSFTIAANLQKND